MEMLFKSYDYNDREKTILVVKQLKTWVLSWWKLLDDSMLKGEAEEMSYKNHLEEPKEQYCSEQDLLEINNEFQNLKKGKMSSNEYAATFEEKMKLVPYLIPTKILKMNTFSIALLVDFGRTVET